MSWCVAGADAPAFVERTRGIGPRSSTHGTAGVAGADAPAFVERLWRPRLGSDSGLAMVSPGLMLRPSLSVATDVSLVGVERVLSTVLRSGWFPVSPGLMLRPSLSVVGRSFTVSCRRGSSGTSLSPVGGTMISPVSPGLTLRPSLSAYTCVAGADAPAFVERRRRTSCRPSLCRRG